MEHPAYNAMIERTGGARLSERALTETIGICRGILADGVVVMNEAQMLLNWLDQNPGAASSWPFDVLLVRLREMLQDGVLDPEEQTELAQTLSKIVGGGPDTEEAFAKGSSSLPLDEPPPTIIWAGKGFVFTGQMACGTRNECEKTVEALGGVPLSGISKKTDYLVIGSVGSIGWLFSTHGRKIEKAIELKREGQPLAIIGEQHWHQQVQLGAK